MRQLSGNIFAHWDKPNVITSASSSSSLRGSISSPSSSEAEISTSIACTIERLFGLEPQHLFSKNYLTCATKDGQYFDVNLLHGLSSLYESLTPEEELIIHASDKEARQHSSFQLIGHMNDLNYMRRRKEDRSTELSSRNFTSSKARNTSGRFKLLVVRVLGKGIEDIVTQSEAKLFDDFFGDSSNVVSTSFHVQRNNSYLSIILITSCRNRGPE